MVFEPPCCLRPGGAAVHASMWLQAPSLAATRRARDSKRSVPRTSHSTLHPSAVNAPALRVELRTEHRAPSARNATPGTQHVVLGPWRPIAEHSVLGNQCSAPSAVNSVLSTGCSAPGTSCRASGAQPRVHRFRTQHSVHSTRCSVLGTQRHVRVSTRILSRCGRRARVHAVHTKKSAAPLPTQNLPPMRKWPPRTEHKVLRAAPVWSASIPRPTQPRVISNARGPALRGRLPPRLCSNVSVRWARLPDSGEPVTVPSPTQIDAVDGGEGHSPRTGPGADDQSGHAPRTSIGSFCRRRLAPRALFRALGACCMRRPGAWDSVPRALRRVLSTRHSAPGRLAPCAARAAQSGSGTVSPPLPCGQTRWSG
jgi:hypothetical protein